MPSKRLFLVLAAAAVFATQSSATRADDAARAGQLIEEMPTLECLGVRWLIAGDDNANARVTVAYRQKGAGRWRRGADLFRVETAAIRKAHRPPRGQTMFAGSVFGLKPGTVYELRLALADPDGGAAERTLRMTTWTEPQLPRGGRTIRVRPGRLREAFKAASPGDVLLLAPGVYRGSFQPPSGTPGHPIALVGVGPGLAILDGEGGGNVVGASGLHDVIFENLTVRNARWGIAVNEGARITLRRCTITDVDYGFVAQRNGHKQQHIFIADCVFRGRSTWPRTKGIENRRAIQVAGTGHVVCHNRISGFGDAIDTFSVYPCSAIDFYRNDISECTDDGIEMDYSEHNTRCFENRLTNVYQGISVQPVHGGPVYVFRNAMFNVGLETFKMHNSPSGALFYHNTSVKAGMPLVLATSEPVSRCVTRNNLFVGTSGNYAFECLPPMRACDFDYDGFAGKWRQFLKWNGARYATLDQAGRQAGVYRHALVLKPHGLFRSGLAPPDDVRRQYPRTVNDLRPASTSAAVDAGIVLPGINDSFRGRAPDLGAYELGAEPPHYGPRPAQTRKSY